MSDSKPPRGFQTVQVLLLLAGNLNCFREGVSCKFKCADTHSVLAWASQQPEQPLILRKAIKSTRNGSQPWPRYLIRSRFGHLTLSLDERSNDLDPSGATYWIKKLKASGKLRDIEMISLGDLLDMDQPGDIFVPLLHPSAKQAVQEYLSSIELGSSVNLFVRSMLKHGSQAVTLGARGQWYHMHIHEMTLFFQVAGRKGWVLAPHSAFPPHAGGREGLPINALSQFDYTDICSPFLAEAKSRTLERKVSNFTLLAHCCELSEGDLLLIPGQTYWSGWWHGVCNLDAWNVGYSLIATNLQSWSLLHD